MSYAFLPPGFIPLVEGASILAYGDRDYLRRLTEVKSDVSGRWQVPREIEPPEFAVAEARIFAAHRAGKIEIIALSRKGQRISDRYRRIPKGFSAYNEWVVAAIGDFELYKPGMLKAARWCYPAVELAAIEQLVSGGEPVSGTAAPAPTAPDEGQPGPAPTKEQIRAILEDYANARGCARRATNMDEAVELVQDKYPEVSQKSARDHYRVVTGNKGRGRRKKPRFPAE